MLELIEYYSEIISLFGLPNEALSNFFGNGKNTFLNGEKVDLCVKSLFKKFDSKFDTIFQKGKSLIYNLET